MDITETNIGLLLMAFASTGFAFIEAINAERKLLSDLGMALIRNCTIFLFYVGAVMYEPIVSTVFWRSTYAIVIALAGYGAYIVFKSLFSLFLSILLLVSWKDN